MPLSRMVRRSLVFVGCNRDLQVRRIDRRICQGSVPQFVQRVRGIGNQFANGDFAILIQRFRKQMQESADLCLEGEFFGGRFNSHRTNSQLEKLDITETEV